MEQYTKELLRRPAKVKEYAPVLTRGVDDVWSMDLADESGWASENDGYKYILVVVDCFSRYGWALPLKTKNATEVWNAFATILDDSTKPTNIWVDKGTEFYNSVWNAKLKSLDIKRYSTYSVFKSAMAERLIQTLKRKIWYHFISKGTRRWIDALPDIIKQYNQTEHSSIDMKPAEARTKENERKLLGKLFPPLKQGKPKYRIGDWVRISRQKNVFEKGYHGGNWSYEIFKIVGIDLSVPVLYHLVDLHGERIEGRFYEQELQRTADKDFFPVQKVLEKRTYKGEKQVLAKLLGYEKPVWMPAGDVDYI